MTVKRTIPTYWFGKGKVPMHARALGALFGRVSKVRRIAYEKGWFKRSQVSAPVIVVGNLTVGGTGKSPLVIAIVHHLQLAGYTPGVASRGYGRSNENELLKVAETTPVSESGDEPAMIARATGVPVHLCADRVKAAQSLIQAGCDVIVCDDGLQHYALDRDIEIEVIDAERRYGNAQPLPAGPMREPPERGDTIDFRVLNWASLTPSQQVRGLWAMTYQYSDAVNVANGRSRSLQSFLHQRVHAVTGIGHPERFFEYLRNRGMLIIPHAFADHHAFVAADFAFDKLLPVLMTSKDAVKCKSFAMPHFYELPISAHLSEEFWQALLTRVAFERDRKLPSNESLAQEPVDE